MPKSKTKKRKVDKGEVVETSACDEPATKAAKSSDQVRKIPQKKNQDWKQELKEIRRKRKEERENPEYLARFDRAKEGARLAAEGIRPARVSDISSCTVSDLQSLLEYNEQPWKGTRDQLIRQVLNCMNKGCLPSCPKHEGWALTWRRVKGKWMYICGYRDWNTNYYCTYRATKDKHERIPWKSPNLPADFLPDFDSDESD